MLAYWIDELSDVVATAKHVIDVAPVKAVSARLLARLDPAAYARFDLGLDNRDVDVLADLTALPLTASSVDVMVVFHVLEHIPNDRAAMREIARVIGPYGAALLHVPWRPDRPTDEDPDCSPEERVARFGQADHVRMYGADFEDRLRSTGLGLSRWEAKRYLDRATVDRLNIDHHLWIVTGVSTDPSETDAQLEALRMRRASLPEVASAQRSALRQLHTAERQREELSRELVRARTSAQRRLAQQRQQLEERVNAVYASNSFRLGWVLLAPTRWIRRRAGPPGGRWTGPTKRPAK